MSGVVAGAENGADVRPGPGVHDPAELVIRNAKVHTGDRRRPAASAVAVTSGVFTAVGDESAVAGRIGPGARVVDALGRRVIPGLNDSHMHVIRSGINYLLELRWDGVRSLRTGLRMLRDQAERTPAGQWVRVVGGWSADQFAEKRLPTVAELNAAAPDTAVLVLHLYQAAIMNRAALAAVGFTKDAPDPPGGQIVRDHAGHPTGVVLATPSPLVLYSLLAAAPRLNPDEELISTRHFLRELNRFGLTSAIDAAGGSLTFPDDYAAVLRLAGRGELSVRLAYHLLPQTPGQELDDLRRWIGMVSPGDGDGWLRANGAGEALILSAVDFENFAEPRPQLAARARDDLEAAVRLLAGNNWGFRLHATYDETIRMALDVFEKIAADGGFGDIPWFFDHAETVTQASLDRIKALGGSVSVQNRMMFQGRAFAGRYGPAAAQSAPPIRAMLDTGLRVAAGTDATRASSYNPWLSLAWLVSGADHRRPGVVPGPEQGRPCHRAADVHRRRRRTDRRSRGQGHDHRGQVRGPGRPVGGLFHRGRAGHLPHRVHAHRGRRENRVRGWGVRGPGRPVAGSHARIQPRGAFRRLPVQRRPPGAHRVRRHAGLRAAARLARTPRGAEPER